MSAKTGKPNPDRESKGILNSLFNAAAVAVAGMFCLTTAAYVFQQDARKEEIKRKAPLMAAFKGHSYMVTSQDAISEVAVNENGKLENVVSYDFSRGVASYGRLSPVPGTVLGMGQLPQDVTDGILRSVCETTGRAVQGNASSDPDVKKFMAGYCHP